MLPPHIEVAFPGYAGMITLQEKDCFHRAAVTDPKAIAAANEPKLFQVNQLQNMMNIYSVPSTESYPSFFNPNFSAFTHDQACITKAHTLEVDRMNSKIILQTPQNYVGTPILPASLNTTQDLLRPTFLDFDTATSSQPLKVPVAPVSAVQTQARLIKPQAVHSVPAQLHIASTQTKSIQHLCIPTQGAAIPAHNPQLSKSFLGSIPDLQQHQPGIEQSQPGIEHAPHLALSICPDLLHNSASTRHNVEINQSFQDPSQPLFSNTHKSLLSTLQQCPNENSAFSQELQLVSSCQSFQTSQVDAVPHFPQTSMTYSQRDVPSSSLQEYHQSLVQPLRPVPIQPKPVAPNVFHQANSQEQNLLANSQTSSDKISLPLLIHDSQKQSQLQTFSHQTPQSQDVSLAPQPNPTAVPAPQAHLHVPAQQLPMLPHQQHSPGQLPGQLPSQHPGQYSGQHPSQQQLQQQHLWTAHRLTADESTKLHASLGTHTSLETSLETDSSLGIHSSLVPRGVSGFGPAVPNPPYQPQPLDQTYHQLQPFDQTQIQPKPSDPASRDAEARILMADSLFRAGSVDLAIYHYQMALWLHPTCAVIGANLGLGNCFAQKGDALHAQHFYSSALRVQAVCPWAWYGLGTLYSSMGDHTQAVMCLLEAVHQAPTYTVAIQALVHSLKESGRKAEALPWQEVLVRLLPHCARTRAALGGILLDLGDLTRAQFIYQEALVLQPVFPEAYNDLGNTLRLKGAYVEATQCYLTCLHLHHQTLAQQHQPNQQVLGAEGGSVVVGDQVLQQQQPSSHLLFSLVVTYNNLAGALKLQNRADEALGCYEWVVRLQPQSSDALASLGNAYKDSSRLEQAIQAYQRALALRPDFPQVLGNLVHSLQCVCEWRDREAVFARVERDIHRQLQLGLPSAVQPFHAMGYPLEAGLVLQLTEMHARHIQLTADQLGLPPFTHPPRQPLAITTSVSHPSGEGASSSQDSAPPQGRLRLGYTSSDFGNHPLSHLMGSVFGLHDRSKIEVFCFALSASDDSEWRRRIEREAEHFEDVSQLNSPQIASRINQLGIQVLVDLNGYTKGARNEIFALRPCPIQVSYMGFPATTGASFIDYLVTDRVVAPPSLKCCYSESLAYMPNCYFVTDYMRCHRDVLEEPNKLTRTEFGLPEGRFIFSCSNQLYKFDPETFTTWCNILHRVPNSVLWLLRFPPFGESRIKKEAVNRGVDPHRIIFTDVALKDTHIRRSGLADLFLDTPLCNAHTTGCDTLWAGCPIVTLPLQRMASRVCASLCSAAGFGPEMVVNSQQEYEDRAVSLALNPPMLASLRSRLKQSRLSCPLFDTVKWVKDFDSTFLKMWDIYVVEGKPRDFDTPTK